MIGEDEEINAEALAPIKKAYKAAKNTLDPTGPSVTVTPAVPESAQGAVTHEVSSCSSFCFIVPLHVCLIVRLCCEVLFFACVLVCLFVCLLFAHTPCVLRCCGAAVHYRRFPNGHGCVLPFGDLDRVLRH